MTKVILITGANSGIGFELARVLAAKGHIVYAAARNESAGIQAVYVPFVSLFIFRDSNRMI